MSKYLGLINMMFQVGTHKCLVFSFCGFSMCQRKVLEVFVALVEISIACRTQTKLSEYLGGSGIYLSQCLTVQDIFMLICSEGFVV